jgi:hypothetical protein
MEWVSQFYESQYVYLDGAIQPSKMRPPQVIPFSKKMEAVRSSEILVHGTTRRHIPENLIWIDHHLEHLRVTPVFVKR